MTDDLSAALELLSDEALEQLDIWLHTLQTEGVTAQPNTLPLLTLSAAVTLGGVRLSTLRLELEPDRQQREVTKGGCRRETN